MCTFVSKSFFLKRERLKKGMVEAKSTTPLPEEKSHLRWFVMRDLKRSNAKVPAYKFLGNMGLEVFTPCKRRLTPKKEWEDIPVIHGLLFVHESRERLDPIVEKMPTLQYRFLPKKFHEPMVVSEAEMERFIHAVTVTDAPRYYLPEEITPEMCGRKIRIMGGSLDGYEGSLLTTRGSKVKRLLVELPGFLSVGVEVNPNYIQLLK